MTHTLT